MKNLRQIKALVVSLFLIGLISGFSITDKVPQLKKSNPVNQTESKINNQNSGSLTNDVGMIVDNNGYYFLVGTTSAPKAKLVNNGTNNQTNIPVTFKITGAVNYLSNKTVSLINSGDTVLITFDSLFSPTDTGTYNVQIYSGLSTDQNRSNDTVITSATSYKANGGYGDIPCRYYFANNIAEIKFDSRPEYCWENPTCYYPLITNGADVSGGRYVGTPDLDDGYFKLKLRNILFACGADTSLKIKMCGQYFDSLFIGTNGQICFTLRDGQHDQFFAWPIIPVNASQNYSIYPLWMDLIFKPGSTLTYGIVGTKLIVTYSKATDFNNQSKYVSFQVAYELVNNPSSSDPNIKFTYGDAPNQTSAGFNFGTGTYPFPLVGLYATKFLHYKMPLNRPIMNGNSGLAVEFGPSPFTLNKLGCDSCQCNDGILLNGNFADYVLGSSSNICPVTGSNPFNTQVNPWFASFMTPQFVGPGGACDSGFIRFWGKRNNGERISQSGLNIQAGRKYQISIYVRLSPNPVVPYGKIGVMFSNAPVTTYTSSDFYNGNIIGGAIPGFPLQGIGASTTPSIGATGITNSTWTKYTYTWDAWANYTTINLNPINDIDDNTSTVSWMDIDNICIKDIGAATRRNILDVNILSEVMFSADMHIVEVRDPNSPFTLVEVDSAISVPNGPIRKISVELDNVVSGNSYWVVVKHINSIETWSANPVTFGDSTSYNFTTSQSKAYGNNLKNTGGNWAIYQGDANQDGFINSQDILAVYNNAISFLSSRSTDFNFDGTTDVTDILTALNNSNAFVQIQRP